MVALKLGVLLLFVGVGVFYVTSANWEPFVPTNQGGFGDFGVTGILRAAGVVFFAYVGFDAVSTAAAEARRPQRTIPIGLLATVLISTVLYVVIGIVMTGMVPYKSLNVADPLALAVREAGGSLDWLESTISAAAVIGLAATVLVTFYGQTRIFMRMSSDGMLPDRLGQVSKRFETPTAATVVCAIAGRRRRRAAADRRPRRPRLDRDAALVHDRLRRGPRPPPGPPRPRAAVPRQVVWRRRRRSGSSSRSR